MPDNLSRFIEHARHQGMDHATIFLLLQSAGWKDPEIATAIAGRELQMAIPERAGVGSARDAFFHLLAFTALYAWAISLISLLFIYISFAFPDPAMQVGTYAIDAALSGIRIGLATLIVAFPLFLATWWFLLVEVRKVPEKAKSGVRRWLTSLSLFVAAVTLLGNAITVVYYLVEGDLTTRFLLKVAVLFVIAGASFVYLALTLRSEAEVRE
ncbi:MAG: DUF5671 domain-containing protein [Pirellulales bacterium]